MERQSAIISTRKRESRTGAGTARFRMSTGWPSCPTDTPEGCQYLNWMNLSMEFARENREKMMLVVKAVLEKWIGRYTELTLEYQEEINCHHNYAALELHCGGKGVGTPQRSRPRRKKTS